MGEDKIDTDLIIENVKEIKGIQDNIQNSLLNILLNESMARILAYINKSRAEKLEEYPTELAYILQDVTVKRFNRLNSEGSISDSEEGRANTWEDYLAEHTDVLDTYHDSNDDGARHGKLYAF